MGMRRGVILKKKKVGRRKDQQIGIGEGGGKGCLKKAKCD